MVSCEAFGHIHTSPAIVPVSISWGKLAFISLALSAPLS